MSQLTLIFSLVILAASVASLSLPESRIIGGQDSAKRGQFPWVANLRDLHNHHICSGAIISTRWVLTVAGCTQYRKLEAETTIIVAGTRRRDESATPFNVLQIINHPFFNWNTLNNDIALVKSKTEMWTLIIRPIAIVSAPVGSGFEATVAGWGRYEIDGEYSNTLKFITAETRTNEECKKELPANVHHLIHDSSLCAFPELTRGNCFGDAGNPLFMKNELIGLASWGIPCAQNKSDVYTRVYSHLDWISQTMDQNP